MQILSLTNIYRIQVDQDDQQVLWQVHITNTITHSSKSVINELNNVKA